LKQRIFTYQFIIPEVNWQVVFQIIFIGLLTGTLIGSVGVGGILLAPFLVYFVGMELHTALATSSFSFLFTGIVGTILYARRKSIHWPDAIWITIGVVPAALLGARVNTFISTSTLLAILAVLIIFSGFNALFKIRRSQRSNRVLNTSSFVAIGFVVGFGSALTGTGGPVILLPILLLFGYFALAAVGISQAIQVPIGVFASMGYFLYGQIDIPVGISLGLVQGIGVFVGGFIAHNLPQERLRKIIGITLIGVGLILIGRLTI
jgi:uncharacterized membrane protein YfcA